MASGLIYTATNAEIDKAKKKEDEAIAAYYATEKPVMRSLVAHLQTLWDRAQRAKQGYEKEFFDAKRQRKGEYSQQQLMAIRALHGDDYVPLQKYSPGNIFAQRRQVGKKEITGKRAF